MRNRPAGIGQKDGSQQGFAATLRLQVAIIETQKLTAWSITMRVRFEAAEQTYDAQIRSSRVASILLDPDVKQGWDSELAWKLLGTYIWRTTQRCGPNTVGQSKSRALRYHRGTEAGGTMTTIWYSASLDGLVQQRQGSELGQGWGNNLVGLYQFDQDFGNSVNALIDAQGCQSEPLRIIEKYFLDHVSVR